MQNFSTMRGHKNMNQLELHKKIEEFIKAGTVSADIKVAQELIKNEDAKRFFFSQTDESWLNWLWQKGFLDGVKSKMKDSTTYSNSMAELDYLTKVAGKEPAKVSEIINSIKISEVNFNPEVVGRFLWIISELPAEQIKTLTAKIKDEKWIYLMRGFRKSGYEFEKIIKKLVEKKESSAILELAQSLLIVKSKTEILEKESSFSIDDPFYVSDLDASGVFEALVDIADSHKEMALQITTGIMAEIIKLAEPDESKVFDYRDPFALYDVDFFTLEIENKGSSSYREDVKNLAATIKQLINRTIGKKLSNTDDIKRLFGYTDKLPSSRSMWRLRLFALSRCPEIFKKELRDAFFKVFEVGERYFEIEGGAEYNQALILCFSFLNPETDQREYVKKIFEYFGAVLEDKDKEGWRKRDGLEKLSFIKEYLTPDEKEEAKKIFNKYPDEINVIPEPTIGKMHVGSVSHRSPVNLDDYTIEQIAENLKSEWTPEKLNEQFKNDDFFQPRGVEGLGDALKENIKKRTNEYLKNINSFFDKNKVHPHYVYSLLRGIEEMLRNDKNSFDVPQIGQILNLFNTIKTEGIREPFKRKDDKSWLPDWITVHKVLTDVLLLILENKERKEEIHKEYKERFRELISYLFTIKDSPAKEDEKPEYGELYGVAINSVRGRAYEAFVVLTENDGKTLTDDTKELYKKTLLDDSLAVRFVIGRYLASFYFRDKEFIIGLLPEIFPKDDLVKKDIYLASWEGYLSNTLYDKLFAKLKVYYSHAITLDPKDYTQRKYFKGLDESLAIHVALSFAHLGLEIVDPLFVEFWNKPNIKRHQEFISFIGRSCLTRDQAGDEWLAENKVSKEKLFKFWDWALENCPKLVEPEALAGFGFWVNPNKEVLVDIDVIDRMAKTLRKSDGNIDWDYGLMRRLPIFAEKNGDKTLEIISNFLLDLKGNLNQNRRAPLFSIDGEIKQSLEIIYKNGDVTLKEKVVGLINNLIEKGSSMFWGLKDVIKEDKML